MVIRKAHVELFPLYASPPNVSPPSEIARLAESARNHRGFYKEKHGVGNTLQQLEVGSDPVYLP